MDFGNIAQWVGIAFASATAVASLIWTIRHQRRAAAIQQFYQVVNHFNGQCREAIDTIIGLEEQKPLSKWSQKELDAARMVCGHFQLVGLLVKEGGVPEKLFCEAWYFAVPVCRAKLDPYIRDRRASRDYRYWSAFDFLAMKTLAYQQCFTGHGLAEQFPWDSVRARYRPARPPEA